MGSEHGLVHGSRGLEGRVGRASVWRTGLGVLLQRGDGSCNLIWSHGFSSVSR